ncbi:MAG: ABC transporter permease, partial [Gemmatimonadetes bacterium]|nr:ABC transporter permease [Gemmatimonadota bacterium]
MDSLRQDLRFALRSLGRSPAFTIVAVLCMALGIAANVFVYSPFNALLLRPMPYREADQVMRVNTWRTEESRQNWASWSWADYQDVRAGTTSHFTATGLYRVGQWNVGSIAEPERVSGARVTSGLLPMLGFQAA